MIDFDPETLAWQASVRQASQDHVAALRAMGVRFDG